ncbi:hypothetical protein [Actinoplanes sp. NPDC049265]|uniref:hypothetical protein n=1 Tax=Actinoplanes sp. NPDC049265 TaxID=3363902 RepID=UPI003720C949
MTTPYFLCCGSTPSLSLRTSAAFDLRRPGVAVTDGCLDPDPDCLPRAGAVRIDLQKATCAALIDLISRGSVPAFAALFERTSDAVRAELAIDQTGVVRVNEILAATYLEVWWLAGCRRMAEADVTGWITGIARRRIAEATRGAARTGGRTAVDGPRPTYAELEIAALLRRPVDRLLLT